ncbi:cell division control protein 2 homolog isoform X4 [Cornus florida]|uniref:cell division control protein 2 homolog isoform X4 n=1 Tax=Cornus florida TaxID=4283 RepID=UPI002896BD0E|nr:cell division control protein 2 homolog isoform X4 [Cornus florida]
MEKYVISNNSVVHGSFGRVYTGYNRETNEPVAFKDIRFFDHVESVPSSVIRHLSLWREMEHSNIIRLLDILNVVQHGTIRVRLVFDYLDINLKKFMDTHSETAKNPHVIKVGPGVLWYHPLEVLLGNSEKNSNPAADVWSAGCIFAEMLHPLLDDSHEIELAEINNNYTLLPEDVGTLDEPNDISLAIILLSGIFHDENNPKNLTDAVPNLESAGLDLLSKMLCTVPEQRITACDALKHPYFDDVVSSPIGYNFLSVFLSEVVLHQLQNLLT